MEHRTASPSSRCPHCAGDGHVFFTSADGYYTARRCPCRASKPAGTSWLGNLFSQLTLGDTWSARA